MVSVPKGKKSICIMLRDKKERHSQLYNCNHIEIIQFIADDVTSFLAVAATNDLDALFVRFSCFCFSE